MEKLRTYLRQLKQLQGSGADQADRIAELGRELAVAERQVEAAEAARMLAEADAVEAREQQLQDIQWFMQELAKLRG